MHEGHESFRVSRSCSCPRYPELAPDTESLMYFITVHLMLSARDSSAESIFGVQEDGWAEAIIRNAKIIRPHLSPSLAAAIHRMSCGGRAPTLGVEHAQ